MTCEACNTIAPVVAEGYEPKGKWEVLDGLKTCTTISSRFLPFPYASHVHDCGPVLY
jgi:hypothetical protein